MQLVLFAILPVFALIALGYAFGRMEAIDARGIHILNAFTVRLALPALLFQSIAQGDWAQLDQPAVIAATAAATAIVFVIGLYAIPVPRGVDHPFADRVLAALGASYANTGFIGIPLLQGLLGPMGLAAGVIGSILTISVLFAIAILLVEIGLSAGAPPMQALRRVARALVRNPLVTAPIAGALWAAAGWPLPGPAARFCTLLGAAASPCALITIGAFLTLRQERADGRALGIALGLKLLVQPAATALLVFVLFPLIGVRMTPQWALAAILLGALPTGTGPFMLAKLYEREAALASRVILLSTIGSVVTLAALAMLLLPH